MKTWKLEPVMVSAIVACLVAVLLMFGIKIDDAMQDQIRDVVIVVIPLIAAWVARANVTPNVKVADRVDNAYDIGKQHAREDMHAQQATMKAAHVPPPPVEPPAR
jgi:hypothetical protein